jgi:hypothetical protein
MREFHMSVSGVSRSYYDFYIGFGYSLSVCMVLQAVLLWLLAGLAQKHPELARPFVAVLFAASIVGAIITWRFIAPQPALISLAVTVTIGVSYFLLRRAKTA